MNPMLAVVGSPAILVLRTITPSFLSSTVYPPYTYIDSFLGRNGVVNVASPAPSLMGTTLAPW